jgi:hypothetical protein
MSRREHRKRPWTEQKDVAQQTYAQWRSGAKDEMDRAMKALDSYAYRAEWRSVDGGVDW